MRTVSLTVYYQDHCRVSGIQQLLNEQRKEWMSSVVLLNAYGLGWVLYRGEKEHGKSRNARFWLRD